ncbi:MAG: DUF4837 family protein [Alistipes sp.]|nr:DUF4837 family protein [Alistipes sp.]
MKQLIKIVSAVALTLIMAASCTTKPQTASKTAIGMPYESFVICDNEAWESGIDSALYRTVGARVAGLPRPESYFYILGHKSHAEASSMERKYGNLISINIDPIYTEPTLKVEDNVYARPQVVISVNAPTIESAKRFIEEHGAEIAGHFEIGERNRSLANSRRSSMPKLMEQFKKHTGIDMHIPAGFGRANSGDRSLLWFMRDYEKKAQYIFAFSQRYNGPEDFEGAALERMLINKLAVVHSDKPGSRLTISQNAPIYWSEIVANGRLWYELRGCWEVTFDQMGGPFVSFSTLDEERGIITTIVFALYAPEEQQRGLMGELEYLIYTAR